MTLTKRNLAPGFNKPLKSIEDMIEFAIKLLQPVGKFNRKPYGPTNLTPRQLEVLKGILEGKTNKEIAAVLFVTEKTVKFHVTDLNKKLGTKTRHEMIAQVFATVRHVREHGSFPLPAPRTAV